MFTNGAIFSMFKHTDWHTVRGRSTPKSSQWAYLSKRVIPRTQNSNRSEWFLAKVLPKPNQKSNDLYELSMNRKCWQSVTVTTDDKTTFTKVFGADKDNVHHDQTLGNNNKDAMFDCKSGFHQREEKRICHIYVTSVMIITLIMFLLKQSALSAIIFVFVPLVLSLVCILYLHVVHECLCGIK